jgi:two-component system cell cycle sensor histidine kinase/response regulator CckA
VHGIVKQSGGCIDVYSEVRHGTTIKIFLPRVRETAVAGRSGSNLAPVPKGVETILLAEDEEGVRRIVQLILESLGYTILLARNGDEALETCSKYEPPIHLLVTDVVMPKMSGRQLVDRIVALRPETKVLYLSGYTDDAVVRHGVLEAGVAFLQKPFTPSDLARKVREVLGPVEPSEGTA